MWDYKMWGYLIKKNPQIKKNVYFCALNNTSIKQTLDA